VVQGCSPKTGNTPGRIAASGSATPVDRVPG